MNSVRQLHVHTFMNIFFSIRELLFTCFALGCSRDSHLSSSALFNLFNVGVDWRVQIKLWTTGEFYGCHQLNWCNGYKIGMYNIRSMNPVVVHHLSHLVNPCSWLNLKNTTVEHLAAWDSWPLGCIWPGRSHNCMCWCWIGADYALFDQSGDDEAAGLLLFPAREPQHSLTVAFATHMGCCSTVASCRERAFSAAEGLPLQVAVPEAK